MTKKSIASIIFVLIIAFAFIQFSEEVFEGDTLSVDTYLLMHAQALRQSQPWLISVMRDLSGLGSTVVLTLFIVVSVTYLSLFSSRITALFVALSAMSGSLLVSMFKAFFGRLRPATTLADYAVSGLSFPSGHAAMSAIVFLSVGALVASTQSQLSQRIYIITIATLLTFLVGISRIMIGVHWASDVIAGWIFGLAWACGWFLLMRYFQPQPMTK